MRWFSTFLTTPDADSKSDRRRAAKLVAAGT
jgi:hypothetical protein